MFSSMYHGAVPGAHNAWTAWTDKIMSNPPDRGFKAVAMVTTGGDIMWYTNNFLPKHDEIEVFNKIFVDNGNQNSVNQITVEGHTYVVKLWPELVNERAVLQPRHLVALRGSRYILVCRSKKSYIVVKAESRSSHVDVAEWLQGAFEWLDKFCQRLIDEKF